MQYRQSHTISSNTQAQQHVQSMKPEFPKSEFPIAISVLGMGETGMVLAAVLAAMGHSVICSDYDLRLVSSVNNGRFVSNEPDLDILVNQAVADSQLIATSDTCSAIRHSQLVFVCQTSVESSKLPNGQVFDARRNQLNELSVMLGKMDRFHSIVYARKVLTADCRTDLIGTLENSSYKTCGVDFGFCLLPCLFNSNQAIQDLQSIDRIKLGANDQKSVGLSAFVLGELCNHIYCTSFEDASTNA